MHQGTIKELCEKICLENVDLTLQEFYLLIKIMEKTGFANQVSVKTHKGAGRQSKIYQVKPNFNVKLNLK